MNKEKSFSQILRTQIGKVGIIWRERDKEIKIIQIILPTFSLNSIKKSYPGIQSGRNKLIDRIARQISLYINGKSVQFSTDILDLKQLGNFQRKVLQSTFKIHRGRIETYGSIAKKVGTPKGARAVGQALAKNPFPIIIPCHRVIKSDGTIGGFGNNPDLKRKLLSIEGACIKK
ncbi:MAG: methylated-DNA--[protein]-cysteine S-methyltransferase [bacterium]